MVTQAKRGGNAAGDSEYSDGDGLEADGAGVTGRVIFHPLLPTQRVRELAHSVVRLGSVPFGNEREYLLGCSVRHHATTCMPVANGYWDRALTIVHKARFKARPCCWKEQAGYRKVRMSFACFCRAHSECSV